MASVTFDQLWLNLVSDESVSRSFLLRSLVRQPAMNVSARANAAGGFRMVSTPGRQQVTKVDLYCVGVDDEQFLESAQGVPVWFRDPFGGKFAGFYNDSTFTPRYIGGSWSVPLTVTEISLSDLL